MKTVISVCPVKASENMHTKAVFIEDEMVSLWPPTVHLHDALMNLSCREEHAVPATIGAFSLLSNFRVSFQMQISEFRLKQRTDSQT